MLSNVMILFSNLGKCYLSAFELLCFAYLSGLGCAIDHIHDFSFLEGITPWFQDKKSSFNGDLDGNL